MVSLKVDPVRLNGMILKHPQWATALDKGRQVAVLFSDIFKASVDKVYHALLLRKLTTLGFWAHY